MDRLGGESGAAEKGAYALLISLPEPVPLRIGRRIVALPPGWYVYAGSAYGPGGIAARLGRHLRRNKQIHWHIDQLTRRGKSLQPFAFPGATECAIVARLLEVPEFTSTGSRIGSSDCRVCASHLLTCTDEASARATLTRLAGAHALSGRPSPKTEFFGESAGSDQ